MTTLDDAAQAGWIAEAIMKGPACRKAGKSPKSADRGTPAWKAATKRAA